MIAHAIAQVARSLVFIEVEREGGAEACGTGFVATPRGFIATCRHLVAGARRIRARPVSHGGDRSEDGARALECRALAQEPQGDLALLATAFPHDLPHAPLHRGEPIGLGHDVAFLGFPYADIFDPPLVMAVRGMIGNRYTMAGVEYVIVDAIAAEGMSGGPLFAAKTGTVIGVVGARFDPARTRAKLRGAADAELDLLPKERTNLTFATAVRHLQALIEKTQP